MPSFTLMDQLCCCKFSWRCDGGMKPATQKPDIQPIPLLNLCPEEEQQEPEEKSQHSLIGLSDIVWAIPVNNSSPGSGSVVHQLAEDDNSDSDQDQPQVTKKPSTAFDVVRNKLIRSISLNNNNDQPSLLSVGNSEEDVARRAELKRIMRQRIQDELDSGELDNDIENKPKNTIRCISSVVELALPNSGPRDAIEFGVSNSSSRSAQSARLETIQDKLHDTPDLQASKEITPKFERHSLAMSGVLDEEDGWKKDTIGPSSSATRLSPHEDADFPHYQKSFQLSNGVARLDRILGPDSSFNSRQASSGDGQSALGVWLIAQGLRSRDNSTLFFDEEKETQAPSETEVTEEKQPVPIGEKMSLESEPREVEEKKDKRASGGPTTIMTSNEMDREPCFDSNAKNDQHNIFNSSGGLAWGPTVTALLNSFADNTSSSDPSNSATSQGRPRQNIYKLDPKDLESMELSPFKWRSQASSQDHENLGEQSFQYFTGIFQSRSYSYGSIHNVQSLAQVSIDPASLAHSESASFVQREAELETIDRRFSEALGCKKPEKKVTTRFKEEFSRSATQPVVHRSFRSRIHLTVPSHFRTKSEGSNYRPHKDKPGLYEVQSSPLIALKNSKFRETEVSDRSNGRSNLSIHPHMSRTPSGEHRKPSLERQESATNLWQRAIRLEAEGRRSSSFQSSTPNPDQRSLSSNRSLNETGIARNDTSSGSDLRREVSQLTPTTDEISSPSNSKWLIERWVKQMRPKTTQTASSLESGLSNRLAGPPRSWSRFPSHNREERNKNADSRDRVSPRDFAVKHVTSEGQIRWATDMISSEEKQLARTLPRSFTIKFGELVKSKVNRMIPSKALRHRVSHPSITRHTTSISARMEYPEMGIRPSESGYTELQALGREISNMKGGIHVQTPERELSKPQSSRSLSDRVVALMHEAIGQRHVKQDEVVEPPECSVGPPTPSLLQESIAATDVFVTPKSHFSDDAADDREKDRVNTDLTKTEEHEIQLAPLENSGTLFKPNDSTCSKRADSDNYLPVQESS
ncbi:Ff.00g052130.m01.CDS01 [Fusarium sp. VM40]|nr:Ff.00g052130.m01.CDS01 [Fusarium sp. VM40]